MDKSEEKGEERKGKGGQFIKDGGRRSGRGIRTEGKNGCWKHTRYFCCGGVGA